VDGIRITEELMEDFAAVAPTEEEFRRGMLALARLFEELIADSE
jgi:hypothetical protein